MKLISFASAIANCCRLLFFSGHKHASFLCSTILRCKMELFMFIQTKIVRDFLSVIFFFVMTNKVLILGFQCMFILFLFIVFFYL